MDICSDLVSIIVPAYQAEKHLKECVCSLLNQTHRAVEIIVVDDGSTDGTSAIVSRMADSDNRLRLITQKNGGVSFARNHGIAASRGSYLMFVDADDWIEPFAVETLLAAIKKTELMLSTAVSTMTATEFYVPVKPVSPDSTVSMRPYYLNINWTFASLPVPGFA